ncbi:MAG: NCS2 family permease [Chthoniobacterales bacterium]
MFERFFRLSENKTTLRRELAAGLTTFATMAYILAVNPAILKSAGMPAPALLTATALSAAIATALMALLTNFPIAMAPGMGINTFFALSICVGMDIPWQSALGLVFINGCIFLLLSISGIRKKILLALPHELKAATSAGIGLFIAFIGLQKGGLVAANPDTLISLGDLSQPAVLLFAAGILFTTVLVARKILGAIILSMAAISLIGLWVPSPSGEMITSLPDAIFSLPASLEPTFFKLNFNLLLTDHLKAIPIILTLLLVDMFDNIGTLIGVTRKAGLTNKHGEIPRVGRALTADSIAAILSSLLGTSTVVSYIESAAGVQVGGKTGLTALTVSACFLLALFLSPVILMIPAVAVAPVLVVVGITMFEGIQEIDFQKFEIAAPAALTILLMPLSYSVSTGMGVGLIALAILNLTKSNNDRSQSDPVTSKMVYLLAAIFLLHFLEPLLAHLF